MLLAIREKATGIIAWVIVGLISITFALFGLGSYFETDSTLEVAYVNGHDIGKREFDNVYQQQRQRLLQLLGSQAALLDDQALKTSLIEEMVDERLTLEMADDGGMRIGDQQVFEAIYADTAFQTEGRYDAERYKAVLASVGQSPAYYENSLRRSLLIHQVQAGLQDSALRLPQRLDALSALLNQRRSFAWVVADAADFADAEPVNEQQIAQHYEADRGRYEIPEQVALEYLELTAEGLAEQADVTEQALRAWYDEHAARYMTPESRQAAHILAQVPANADDAAVAAARQRLMALKARIDGGEDFGALAKTDSDDPASAERQGTLGEVVRGQMVAPFEAALFELAEPGGVSDPVRTDFGWHLIQLQSITPAQGKPFEAVRAEVERAVRSAKAEEAFYDLAETLADQSYEHPDTLSAAAQALGLTIQTTALLDRGGASSGIGSYPQVVAEAFSEDVLVNGNNSAVVELADNHAVVLRVAQRVDAHTPALDDVRELIRNALASAMASDAAKTYLERIDAGAVLATLAQTDAKLAYDTREAVKRDAADLPPALLTEVFRMPKPDGGGAKRSIAPLADGRFALIELTAVATDAEADAATRASWAEREAQVKGQRELRAAIRHLRADAEVQIVAENL